MQFDEDLVGGKLGGSWDLDVLLVLEGGFEAILAVEDPLTSHGVFFLWKIRVNRKE